MPNFIGNYIDFSNTDKKVFQRICKFMNSQPEMGEDASRFDFNRLIPAPKHLGNTANVMPWYEWRMKNWGTKWNPMNLYIDMEKQIIQFDTAYTFPRFVARALTKKFPTCNFCWYYAAEDVGYNVGYFSFDGGSTETVKYADYSEQAIQTHEKVWKEFTSYLFKE